MFISVGLFKIHFVGCSLSFFNLRTHVPEIFLNYLFKIYPSFPLFFLWNSSYSDVGPPYTFITLYFLITFSLLFSISVLWETLFSKPYWNIHFCYLTFYFQEFFFCCWMFLFKKKIVIFLSRVIAAVLYFSGDIESLFLFFLLWPDLFPASYFSLFHWRLHFSIEVSLRHRWSLTAVSYAKMGHLKIDWRVRTYRPWFFLRGRWLGSFLGRHPGMSVLSLSTWAGHSS